MIACPRSAFCFRSPKRISNTTLNHDTIVVNSGAFINFLLHNHSVIYKILIFFFRRSKRQRNFLFPAKQKTAQFFPFLFCFMLGKRGRKVKAKEELNMRIFQSGHSRIPVQVCCTKLIYICILFDMVMNIFL